MGAAFALAGSVAKQEHERNGGALKFVLETPINLRPHCGIPDKLMGPFVTSFPDNVTVKSTTRFWDKATSSKSSLEAAIQKRAPMRELGVFADWQAGMSSVEFAQECKQHFASKLGKDKNGSPKLDPEHGREEAIGITNLGRSGLA